MLNTSLSQIAAHSSEREVAAVNAERDVDDMKMAEYMEIISARNISVR